MEAVFSLLKEYFYVLSFPKVGLTDILEILIIAFTIYHVSLWVKKTRAWALVKGILILFLCYIIAYLLDMSVILWIFNKTLAIGITALLIVFQPELRKALEELGAEVCVINDSPNGININENCGSTHLENLAAFVTECGAYVGLAFDGDADRVLAVDENGHIVDGDKIMTVIGLDMKKNGKLPDNTIVATVMSNLGFFVMGEENGINIKRTKVGDRYVLEEMLKNNHLIGGEQSGHVILLEHNTTGDGLVTGIQLVSVLKHSGKRLSELASAMQVYPQVLINASVKNELKNEENYMKFPEIKQAIEALESEFKDTGRVLIRPSGTEPLVRVMIEGKDENLIEKRARELANLFEAKLN